jgi:uncharacterized protein (TIGR00369 family)
MKGMDAQPQLAGDTLPRSGPHRHVPFSAHLGIRHDRVANGEAVVSLELAPHMLNNHGAGHGGVVMTLLDSAMAHAALSRVDYAREVVTVDMQVVFMRPTAGRLVATGRAVGGGRSLCFCEASINDADGNLAVRAMGSFRYRD